MFSHVSGSPLLVHPLNSPPVIPLDRLAPHSQWIPTRWRFAGSAWSPTLRAISPQSLPAASTCECTRWKRSRIVPVDRASCGGSKSGTKRQAIIGRNQQCAQNDQRPSKRRLWSRQCCGRTHWSRSGSVQRQPDKLSRPRAELWTTWRRTTRKSDERSMWPRRRGLEEGAIGHDKNVVNDYLW